MNRSIPTALLALAALCLAGPDAFGQMSGSRGVARDDSSVIPELPRLTRETIEGYITVEGRAEIRVEPSEIRMVLAVTGEGTTAQECRNTVYGSVDRVKQAWAKIGIPADSIVVDFIAVLPNYEWNMETRGDRKAWVEKKVGYRMQTNVHLAARGDAEAQAALAAAFEEGVTDILAFVYWSKELDDVKPKVRQQALDAARGKADVLLGAMFEHRPPAINVQEQTQVFFPESLYQSFVASDEEMLRTPWRDSTEVIHADRPRNTYYRGLEGDGDVTPRELPMRPEISVVSTVRLYFESPAAERSRKRHGKKENKQVEVPDMGGGMGMF
jgi:uncharacterized protein YggE